MNPQKKTAVVTVAAGFPGGLRSAELPLAGGAGLGFQSSGVRESSELNRHAVRKAPLPDVMWVRSWAGWASPGAFAGGFSRVVEYFRDFMRIPA